MLIRKAELSEIIGILSLYKKELDRLIEFTKPSGQLLKEFVDIQKSYEDNPNFGFFIALKNDEIVGAVLINKKNVQTYKNHSVVQIKHLTVSRPYRSLTIGTQLLEHAQDGIKKHIIQNKLKSCKIIIEISEEISHSKEYFEKLGYAHEGMISDYHVDSVKVHILGKTLRI